MSRWGPTRMADCHPERPHEAKGLCLQCYRRHFHETHRDYRRNWYRKTYRLTGAVRRRRETLAKHGLSAEDYDEILVAQGGVCRICGSEPSGRWYRLAVDHDHDNGLTRGLLCERCNRLLGFVHDEVELLENAARYLRRAEKCVQDWLEENDPNVRRFAKPKGDTRDRN